MTIRIIRLETAQSDPRRTRAGGELEPGEPVKLTANVPPDDLAKSPALDDPAGQICSGRDATAATEATHDAAFTDETDSSHTVWLPSDKAASYLSSLGYSISTQGLAELAITGDGPESCCWEGHEFFEVTQLVEWATGRANTPSRTAYHPMA